MGDHAQLTAREIHGPFVQTLTNLQGNDGQKWLEELKKFNRKEPTWVDPPHFHRVGETRLYMHKEYEFDAREFFRTREGIQIADGAGFGAATLPELLEKTAPIVVDQGGMLEYFELDYHLRQYEIKEELRLPMGGEIALWQIALLLKRQMSNRRWLQRVLSTEHVNVFFISRKLTVRVNWVELQDGKYWHIYTASGEMMTNAGSRVFLCKVD